MYIRNLKVSLFEFLFLQQAGLKGHPETESQKPGGSREDNEQDSEKNKVNALCIAQEI